MLILINKILILIYVLAVINTIRHAYYFIQSYISTYGDEPVKYIISDKSLLLVGLSIAYIITGMLTGITL
jgi:hypothetical protein